MRRRTTIIGLILCALTVGCFDIFNFPKKPPFPVIAEASEGEIAAAQQFMEQVYEAACRQIEACNYQPFQRCMEDVQPRIAQGKRLAAQGQWRLREAAAKACLAVYPTVHCGLWTPEFRYLAECSLAIEGLVDKGGSCEQDYACASGDCHRSGADECSLGTCTGNAGEPVTCRTDSSCTAGLRCGGKCVAQPARGETCIAPGSGACGSRFICREVNPAVWSGALQCLPPAVIGEACRRDRDCVQGAFCRDATPENSGICTAFYRWGEACPEDSIYCAAGLQCEGRKPDTMEGICDGPRPLDAACVVGRRQCALPGYCSEATGKCEDGAALHERCGDMNEKAGEYRSCKEGWCSGSGRYAECVPRAKQGEACEGNVQCAAGLVCDGGSGRCVVEACR